MQALKQASRRTVHASVVIQNARAATLKGFSSEAGSSVAARKSKEERYELAKQFVAKFKAANNGQLPGISLLRKEVGGKYETLKEVFQELSKGEDAVNGTKEALKENLKGLEAVKEAASEGKPQEFAATTQRGSKRKSTIKNDLTDSVTCDTKGPDSLKQMAQLMDTEEGDTQELAATAKDGSKRKSTARGGDSKKNREETPPVSKGKETHQISKSSKSVISVEELLHKPTSKDKGQTKQSLTATKSVSNSAMDSFFTSDEDDDDDSDVAAPEYHLTSLTQKARQKIGVEAEKSKEHLVENVAVTYAKMDMKKQNGDQAMESKPAGMQQGDQRTNFTPKGKEAAVNPVIMSRDETAAKHPMTDDSFSSVSKGGAPLLTTVVRILNLPSYMTENRLKSFCEKVAKVHCVEYRRGRIADVQFDVDLHEMNHIMNKLKTLTMGPQRLRVCAAQKFLCESKADSKFKPRDAHHYKQVRNLLIYSIEQRFKFLCRQVEDYRELQELKLAR